MVSPNRTEIETQWQNGVAMGDNLLAAQTIVADQATYDASIKSDFANEMARSSADFRSNVSDAFNQMAVVQNLIFFTYAKFINRGPVNTVDEAITKIFDEFIREGLTVQSRLPTFGSITPGSLNGGNGTIRRLLVDAYDMKIESITPESKTYVVVEGAGTGTTRRGQELINVLGSYQPLDFIDAEDRSGVGVGFRAQNDLDSLVGNPAFTNTAISGTFSGGVYTLQAGDSITGWELLDPSNVADPTLFQLTQNAADIFRSNPSNTTPQALRFLNNAKIRQKFTVNSINLQPGVAYDLAFILKKESSAAGTVYMKVGETEFSQALSGMTNGENKIVYAPLDKGLWPRNMANSDMEVEIRWEGGGGGSERIVVGQVLIVPMTVIDGLPHSAQGGSVDFQLNDEYTVTDSIASDSKLQKWVARNFGRYFPHATVATQVVASGGNEFTFVAKSGSVLANLTHAGGGFSWAAQGFTARQKLTIASTSSNDGDYIIDHVDGATLYIIESEDFTAEGPTATGTADGTRTLADPA